MLRTEYTYIHFVELPKPAERKTPRWSCISVRHGDVLGTIAWLGAWRQFVFAPAGATVWSAGCAADIQHFLDQLNKQRRA